MILSNGLTKGEEKTLKDCLGGLQPILDSACRLGGGELATCRDLERRLKNRLEPEAPAQLEAAGRDFIAQFGPGIEKAKERDRKREEEAAALAAQHKAMRDERAAEVRRMIHAEQERRREGMKNGATC